jgi:hypothetical protein
LTAVRSAIPHKVAVLTRAMLWASAGVFALAALAALLYVASRALVVPRIAEADATRGPYGVKP